MTASSSASALRAVATDGEAEQGKAGDAQPAPPAAEQVRAPEKKKRRSPVLPLILAALLSGAGWYGYGWWTDGRFLISTDDAYIKADIAIVSPKVAGYVEKVNVVENQQVRAGDPLVTLDGRDYQIALERATNAIESARLAVKRIDAQIVGAEAALKQAEAQRGALEAALRGAEITERRAGELASKSIGTAADLDNARVALDQARANLVAGEASVASAEANIGLLRAQRDEALNSIRAQELARDQAQRDLDFTVLKAPYDGVIGNLAVQTGDLVSAGKRLAALVPLTELYVEANFKETQIGNLEPGSKVRVHVDAFEEHDLVGTVTSLAPASGSVFSMLPAENATGNFTKVVQRVPVRIALPEEALAQGRLRAGLSVVVDVDTRTAPSGDALAAAD
ncbi:Multidrug resistance efflux pump [Pseudorhizobium banfieldiae]|uniref:Multidrug resistance efflux pump n=1 Tax=Pseudorhizobium banfieldiae TaxID=1125847 RepID=L0NI38_9HYPH|nr:HlyD family secretion protein [Pseudorhizobium banfieldiae]CAD6616597.1 HlyD family secretion protein [arsenite-oxidising bacterium NT-25]CCF20549.1 Multidrug resistance efflux pump [Pseudorhizobium banfieldiae]